MPSDEDKRIFELYVTLENALAGAVLSKSSTIADAINRLIDAHVQRAIRKRK